MSKIVKAGTLFKEATLGTVEVVTDTEITNVARDKIIVRIIEEADHDAIQQVSLMDKLALVSYQRLLESSISIEDRFPIGAAVEAVYAGNCGFKGEVVGYDFIANEIICKSSKKSNRSDRCRYSYKPSEIAVIQLVELYNGQFIEIQYRGVSVPVQVKYTLNKPSQFSFEINVSAGVYVLPETCDTAVVNKNALIATLRRQIQSAIDGKHILNLDQFNPVEGE